MYDYLCYNLPLWLCPLFRNRFPFFSSKHFLLLNVPNRNPQTKTSIKHGKEKGRRSMSTPLIFMQVLQLFNGDPKSKVKKFFWYANVG